MKNARLFLFAAALVALAGFSVTASAQQTSTPTQPAPAATTAAPTTEAAATEATPETTAEASMAGVGVTPFEGVDLVNVRRGPGTNFTVIGLLRAGRSLDATGYNFDLSRNCSANFAADLDMWIQVDFNGQEGWVARCVVSVSGSLANLEQIEDDAIDAEATADTSAMTGTSGTSGTTTTGSAGASDTSAPAPTATRVIRRS